MFKEKEKITFSIHKYSTIKLKNATFGGKKRFLGGKKTSYGLFFSLFNNFLSLK